MRDSDRDGGRVSNIREGDRFPCAEQRMRVADDAILKITLIKIDCASLWQLVKRT